MVYNRTYSRRTGQAGVSDTISLGTNLSRCNVSANVRVELHPTNRGQAPYYRFLRVAETGNTVPVPASRSLSTSVALEGNSVYVRVT